MLIVSDSGHGIPAELQARIYDPFFSTKKTGTGLGLAVVRGIVEQNGGQIWLYSEVDQGTTFKIFFPRFRETATIADLHPEIGETSLGGTETILLVEDEELLRVIMRETLEGSGYRVLAAASPEHALALSREHAGGIDLLLTDVVMPGMNGKQLAEQLLNERPDLNVIYMSGYTDDIIAHRGVLEARERFIEKPAPAEALLQTVREVLDSRSS